MMQQQTLPHATKVQVRKALKALRTLDETQGQSSYAEDRVAESLPLPTLVQEQRITVKAGFKTRLELEAFAQKHNLL